MLLAASPSDIVSNLERRLKRRVCNCNVESVGLDFLANVGTLQLLLCLGLRQTHAGSVFLFCVQIDWIYCHLPTFFYKFSPAALNGLPPDELWSSVSWQLHQVVCFWVKQKGSEGAACAGPSPPASRRSVWVAAGFRVFAAGVEGSVSSCHRSSVTAPLPSPLSRHGNLSVSFWENKEGRLRFEQILITHTHKHTLALPAGLHFWGFCFFRQRSQTHLLSTFSIHAMWWRLPFDGELWHLEITFYRSLPPFISLNMARCLSLWLNPVTHIRFW